MADTLARVVVDCSVVVKWKIPTEDHAAVAPAAALDAAPAARIALLDGGLGGG